jgi:hypothetical protein
MHFTSFLTAAFAVGALAQSNPHMKAPKKVVKRAAAPEPIWSKRSAAASRFLTAQTESEQ